MNSQIKQKTAQIINAQGSSYTFDIIKDFFSNLGLRELKLIKSSKMKKFLKMEQKTMYSQQIYELIAGQMYNHLSNIFKRQSNALLQKYKLREVLEVFDYFLFRTAIMEEVKQEIWDDFDQDQQFLDQLEKELDHMYEEL